MQFKDVIGHQAIKRNLIQTVKENRISHAQLYVGKEGVGCLPLAIAYAQYINCMNKGEEDSCGHCASCKKYQKLIHPDLHFVFPVVKNEKLKKKISDDYLEPWREFITQQKYFTLNDWYSSISMENKQGSIYEAESDSIIRKLSLKSFEGTYKTMIIWKPEKMNRFSANRLLKLIEEPPPRTILLMVTSEIENILPTILSRTFQVKVPAIDDESMFQAIKQQFTLSNEAIQNIIRISSGSFSEAINNVEKSEENKINFTRFQELMRIAYSYNVPNYKKNGRFQSEELKEWVEQTAILGREKQKSFLQNGLRLIRENFVFNLNEPKLLYLSSEEHDWAKKFSPFIKGSNIKQLLDELGKAQFHIERNVNAKFVFFDLALKLSELLKE